MTGGLSKNFHGVGIGPLSKILAVKSQKKGIGTKMAEKFERKNKNKFQTCSKPRDLLMIGQMP
jgi:hypothetical protein